MWGGEGGSAGRREQPIAEAGKRDVQEEMEEGVEDQRAGGGGSSGCDGGREGRERNQQGQRRCRPGRGEGARCAPEWPVSALTPRGVSAGGSPPFCWLGFLVLAARFLAASGSLTLSSTVPSCHLALSCSFPTKHLAEAVCAAAEGRGEEEQWRNAPHLCLGFLFRVAAGCLIFLTCGLYFLRLRLLDGPQVLRQSAADARELADEKSVVRPASTAEQPGTWWLPEDRPSLPHPYCLGSAC